MKAVRGRMKEKQRGKRVMIERRVSSSRLGPMRRCVAGDLGGRLLLTLRGREEKGRRGGRGERGEEGELQPALFPVGSTGKITCC